MKRYAEVFQFWHSTFWQSWSLSTKLRYEIIHTGLGNWRRLKLIYTYCIIPSHWMTQVVEIFPKIKYMRIYITCLVLIAQMITVVWTLGITREGCDPPYRHTGVLSGFRWEPVWGIHVNGGVYLSLSLMWRDPTWICTCAQKCIFWIHKCCLSEGTVKILFSIIYTSFRSCLFFLENFFWQCSNKLAYTRVRK